MAGPVRLALSALALLAFAGWPPARRSPRPGAWALGQICAVVVLGALVAVLSGAGAGARFAGGWVAGWSVALDLAVALAALSGFAGGHAESVPIATGSALAVRAVLALTGGGIAARAVALVVGAALVAAGGWWAHRAERAQPPPWRSHAGPGPLLPAVLGALFAVGMAAGPGGREPAVFGGGLLALLAVPVACALISGLLRRIPCPQEALSVLLAFAGVKTALLALLLPGVAGRAAAALLSVLVLAAVAALGAMSAARSGS